MSLIKLQSVSILAIESQRHTLSYSWGIVEEKFQIELNHYFKFNIDSKVFLEV